MPLVSVIMPSYNHERYVAQAIESVQAQTVPDWELIIIDDASCDQSCQVIDGYADRDKRIRTIFHEMNRGIALTMNEALDVAKGKYISFFASDDLWLPQKLERQLPILEKDENLIVWSDGLVVDSNGKQTGELFTSKHGAVSKVKSGNLFGSLVNGNYICGQSCIFNHDNVSGIRFDPNLKYLNDYKFQLELAVRYAYHFIKEPLVQYRVHGNSSNTQNRDQWERDAFRLSRFLIKNYSAKLSRESIARCYKRMGVHLLNRRHPRYARKCFAIAIKNNYKKTSYYKKFIKAAVSSLLS